MSSTSRGSQRSPADFYSTPSFAIHRLLERVKLPGGNWLEFAAGEGAIIKSVNDFCRNCRPGFIEWTAIELRNECKEALHALTNKAQTGVDFLKFPPPKTQFAVAISNPPFSIAQEMIEHSLHFAPYVIHLLRLNYLETEKRCQFFQSNCPDVFILPDRISFTGDGKADSTAYCFMYWGPERNRRTGRIEVLDHTPVENRR